MGWAARVAPRLKIQANFADVPSFLEAAKNPQVNNIVSVHKLLYPYLIERQSSCLLFQNNNNNNNNNNNIVSVYLCCACSYYRFNKSVCLYSSTAIAVAITVPRTTMIIASK